MSNSTLKPCPHMKTLLSALADGSLTGVARWFTENHAKGCPGCGYTLGTLRTLRERVRALGVPEQATLQLPEDRWAKVEAAWEEQDRTTGT